MALVAPSMFPASAKWFIGRATVQYQIGPSQTYLSVANCPGWSMK